MNLQGNACQFINRSLGRSCTGERQEQKVVETLPHKGKCKKGPNRAKIGRTKVDGTKSGRTKISGGDTSTQFKMSRGTEIGRRKSGITKISWTKMSGAKSRQNKNEHTDLNAHQLTEALDRQSACSPCSNKGTFYMIMK